MERSGMGGRGVGEWRGVGWAVEGWDGVEGAYWIHSVQ